MQRCWVAAGQIRFACTRKMDTVETATATACKFLQEVELVVELGV